MYKFKSKDSEIKPHSLSLGNISKDFTINTMKRNRIKRNCKKSFCQFFKSFPLLFSIDTIDVLDIHRFLMKET